MSFSKLYEYCSYYLDDDLILSGRTTIGAFVFGLSA